MQNNSLKTEPIREDTSGMSHKLKVQYWPIDEVHPYPNNPRNNDDAVEYVANSIREFSFQQPLVVDTDGTIIAGHTRLKAAKLLGMDTVPVVVADNLTPAQVNAYRLADNKVAEAATWDMEALAVELEGLEVDFDMTMFDFDASEFDFGGLGGEPTEIVEDEVPEDAPPIVQKGDVWKLGRHRLMCGDSTDTAAIDRLMDGVKADMVFTDPPYNIASDSKNFAADVSKAMKNLSESEWDKNFDIREVFDNILVSIADNVTVYICTSHFLASEIWEWMKQWSDHYLYCVWSKPNPMPSLSKRHWTWNTELICYATRGKHTFNFPKEGHALSTWTINKKNGDTGHPTEKPVEVPAMAVTHSSKENDIVLDLFGGSGSTLIACEQLNRTCYMMELDPHYCDIIIERWQNLTGETARKVEQDG